MKKLIVLLVATLLSSPGLSAAADAAKGGVMEPAGTSVKSSKSNGSDRSGAPTADAATTVKGSKSNSSERGGAAAVDAATSVKSGKSNTSD